jgi:tetratricopeptide (TPR) repeat protein/predicted Ser/Thr protein kinase
MMGKVAPGPDEYDEILMSLVESAMERPPEEREQFLRAACSSGSLYDDARLRVEWEERMGGFLHEAFVSWSDLADETPEIAFDPDTLLDGRFRVVRKVGQGGMGLVYEALDEKLGRRVAIKCARLGFQHRLPPEARTAREVSHFNVCKVHDIHTATTAQGEIEFLSMEFVEGETLSEYVKRKGRLQHAEALDIARQICAGLAQAHRQGVIHGDLKGGNIILARTAEGKLRPVIMDFGLAKLSVSDSGSPFGAMASARGGTLDYMAPELFLGERVSVASDLYALGVIFHTLLTGETPAWNSPPGLSPRPATPASPQDTTVTLARVVQISEQINEADWGRQIEPLPAPWKKVVTRCLAPRPAKRYASAEQVRNALEPRRLVLKWAVAAAILAALAFAFWPWRAAEPVGPPVRLAVLPFAADGPPIPSANGIGVDIADRLSGARRGFLVIPPADALRNQVDSPEKAKSMLGATHVLRTRLQNSGGQIVAIASVVDTGSGQTLRDLHGSYSTNDTSAVEKALLATVTGAFHLRAAPAESVSDAAHPFYVQGIALIRRDTESADAAIPLFNKAIELDPKSASPYAGLAQAQAQKFHNGQGREWLDQAAASAAKAKSINGDSVQVLLASGVVQQEQGRYEPAIRDFSRATELDPNNMEAWRLLALTYESSNRPEDAIATYRKAIQEQPNYYRTHLTFGTFYYRRSQFRDAEEAYRRAVSISPNLEDGHMDLGLALMGQGRLREAEESMLKSLSLRETPSSFVNLGALYYIQERYSEAARLFEKSLAGGSRTATRYRDLGAAYQHLGQKQEALSAYRAGRVIAADEVAHSPRRAASRALMALLSGYLGDSTTALFEITQALETEPENVSVKRYAVFTYEAIHQRGKTLEVLHDAPAHLLQELNRQPDLKDLRQDARFQELIQKK